MEAINESLHPPMDNRVREACQYISDYLADSNFDIASVAQHVCLSPSRLSHLFRQQLGISVLSWREDQRISQAKAAFEHHPDAYRHRRSQCWF